MKKRFVVIWFRYLKTDWFTRRQPGLKKLPLALAAPSHGRMIIVAANACGEAAGIFPGMTVADARALYPSLSVKDDLPELSQKLLRKFAGWFIRFTPIVSIESQEGMILDATGCAHLWGSEKAYLSDIISRLNQLGYYANAAMADTIGAAWAASRFGNGSMVIESGDQLKSILGFPAAALRLETETLERFQKLGLLQVKDFISMPRTALRRRFGTQLLQRIDQAAGREVEIINPEIPVEPYQERLVFFDPVVTRAGIEKVLHQLLQNICVKLKADQKGIRSAILKCFRLDGTMESIAITTTRATYHEPHLFKLFELKIERIDPASGIELFLLEAQKVEEAVPMQEKLWESASGFENQALYELLDRLMGRFGAAPVRRYIPDEHYWPERSVKLSAISKEQMKPKWKLDRPRPLQLLPEPQPIEVTAPIPDYPPMLFRYKGQLHSIKKADGPERIEQEWWLQSGQHRDYYCVEDENGQRYWIFRLGHYDAAKTFGWFLHGYFA